MDMEVRTAPEDVAPDDMALVPDRRSRTRRSWIRRHPWLAALAVFVALVATAAGAWWWINGENYASTTDAQIAGNVTQIAPQVTGRVTTLLFTDNQHVTAGQKLLTLDPREYQAKLDQALAQQASAEAQLTQMRAQLQVKQADLDEAKANVTVAEADLLKSRQDYERYQRINPAAISQQVRDQASAAFRSDTAKLAAAKQAVAGAAAQIEVAKAQTTAAEASVKQADAAVENARLQLSYTAIAAPVTGRVTHRTVNVGDVVQPGQALFALVQDDLWVDANFKETQLAGMRRGQPVTIRVDAVPGVTFHGKVASLQSGTGSVFSALPAENATGNWVKVVQRLPVKIVFDGNEPQQHFLAPGMSAEPTVKLR